MGIFLRWMPLSFGRGADTPSFDDPVILLTVSNMRLLISPLALGLLPSFLKGIASSFSPSRPVHSVMVWGDTNS